jgi:hypothetical protein
VAPPDPTTTCLRRLDLRLIARNGDILGLAEDVSWTFPDDPEPSATWRVDQNLSTGRFATYAGSGAYSSETFADGRVRITLSGTLGHA